MVEFKSLFLGILFSVGIFSIKAGVGLYYRLNRESALDLTDRSDKFLGVSLGFVFLYGILFAGVAVGVSYLDIETEFQQIQSFLKSGMVIHLIIACLMLVWGVLLLKSSRTKSCGSLCLNGEVMQQQRQSAGWLALVLPCPVCITVIGISEAFILALFPGSAVWSVVIFYLSFITLSFLTVFLMGRSVRLISRSPEALLGYAMTIISSYFLLSIIIMPQFSGVEEIARLAAGGGSDSESTATLALFPIAVGVGAALFTAGYLHMQRKIVRYLPHI